ncbi:MAG: glycosyltransferase family 39 protein, partial [Planctomycetes bacterium]|nr:glycosyltransferase family 39 protein [Planctomycetota bacterium]
MVDLATKEDESARSRTGVAWGVALCLLAAGVVFNQSAVHWRANVNDSHYYAYCGWRVSQGAVPYLDVWNNKPAGTWWVNAAGFLICGPGIRRELLICSIAVAVSIAVFVALARTAYHRSLWPLALVTGGVLLTHLRYECGGNRTETFVVPCEILAVLGYLCWRRSGRWSWLVLGGLFAGAAPLFKQSGLAALGACAVHLALSQLASRWSYSTRVPGKRWWVPWLIGGGAAITLPAIAAIVLGTQGALREACFAVAGFNQAYFEVNDATWLNLWAAFQPYLPELPPLYGLLLLAAAGAVLGVLQPLVFRQPSIGRWVARGFSRGEHES